jgi:hypothetical protein
MPSSPNYKRNLKQEAKTDKARGGPAKRAKRNAARRAMAKKVGKAAIEGKDVGHKTSLKSGGSNSAKNTKVQSVKSNRSHGGKIGNKAGKAAGGRKGMASRWGNKKK